MVASPPTVTKAVVEISNALKFFAGSCISDNSQPGVHNKPRVWFNPSITTVMSFPAGKKNRKKSGSIGLNLLEEPAQKKTTATFGIKKNCQVTFLSPIVAGHSTFERVTFSPSQKGHQQNCQVLHLGQLKLFTFSPPKSAKGTSQQSTYYPCGGKDRGFTVYVGSICH